MPPAPELSTRPAAGRAALAPAALAGAAPGEWLVFDERELVHLTGVPRGAAGIAGLCAGAHERQAIPYREIVRLRLVERAGGPLLRLLERGGEVRAWAVAPAILPALRPTLERVASRLARRRLDRWAVRRARALARRAARRLRAAWRDARS